MSEPQTRTTALDHAATASIIALLVLTAVMLLALFSRTQPHPPLDVSAFALAPFLATSLALGAAALHLVRQSVGYGTTVAVLFALTAVVSFGPQKYADVDFSRIWPAVITAEIAVLVILIWAIVKIGVRASGER